MPRYPETQALLEHAVRHVLGEQEQLLKRPDVGKLNKVLRALNQLAINTSSALAGGFSPSFSTAHLTKEAVKLEKLVDNRSESLWTPILVSVSGIYERIEASLERKPGKLGFAADVRAHYHNLRIGLLEQMIGARMLQSYSDLGDETERIWQQFLERQLGPSFKVLRGGQIRDHEGKSPPVQSDLIVVPADAVILVPGDSEGGKVQVLVDQVVSAIEVTANLTTEKLKQDWKKLQSLPSFGDMVTDFPHLKGHPWPLCFILAANSEPADDLKKAWSELCEEGLKQNVPQLIVSLDSGYLYSGARRWPAARFPSNYNEPGDVHAEDGIYAGLGLAWLLAQHQGRLAAIRRQAVGPITRFAKLLDDAMLREGVPPTYSRRFDTALRLSPISGVFAWGSSTQYAHNKLELGSVSRNATPGRTIYETEIFQAGVDTRSFSFMEHLNYLRWFRYGAVHQHENLLALEEWTDATSKTNHRSRIAVFNVNTGEEITGPEVDALKVVNDLGKLKLR